MANSSPLQAVIFRIGDVTCALPAGIVREVLPRLPATRIPGASGAVEGLVNVRGALLTVLDGHTLLRQAERAGDEGAIIVLDVGDRRCGLGVAQVLDFLELPGGTVAERGELPGVDPNMVSGVGVHRDRHFILLDVDRLLAPLLDQR
jgi:purine-binding chemotaxis protein CheW